MKITQPSPIKIALFHVMAANFSGAGKTLLRLLRTIDSGKLKIVLVGQRENELTGRARRLGIEVNIIPYPPALDVYGRKLLKLRISELPRTIVALWQYNVALGRLFAKSKVQVVWADNIRTFFFVYAASKLAGCEVIWNIWSEPKGKAAWAFHRLGLILADVVNLEYRGQAKKLFGRLADSKLLGSKLVTLYTGVTDDERLSGSSIRDELNLSSSDTVILMASNIAPEKGQLDLLTAMQALILRFPNLHLLLAGQPLETHPDTVIYDARLKRYADEKRLVKNVHFLGWRSDMPDLFQAADIYVSSSYTEALPDSVREAMLSARAVIATNVGGTSELIKHGINGFLFEPGDVDSFIRILSQLMEDSQLRVAMGVAGKRIMQEDYSTEAYARRFEDMVFAVHR